MKSLIRFAALVLALGLTPTASSAQEVLSCKTWERFATENAQPAKGHLLLRGDVELTCDQFKFFAEQVDVYTEEDRMTAFGNVLFTSPDTRITAARLEFNLKTKTGIFYDAAGTARVKPALVDSRSMFGTQEAEMQFRGEKLERLSERKYRLTNGGFTSCLQPTARWEFTSGSVTINIDNYVVARNTTFRVKGVPLFWLPIIYYPLQEDDRATGFLMPGYGNSQAYGHTMRNAFFWAIGRSADATFEHNLFSKAGQAFNAQFRYVASLGSRGDLRFSLLDEKAYVIRQPNGAEFSRPAARSMQVRGDVTHELPKNFRLGASANYTNDITARQLYQQNFYQSSNATSSINANISGSVAGLQIGALFSRNEIFTGTESSYLTGSAPRLTISRAEQPIGNLPIYWSLSGEAVGILAETRTATTTDERNRFRADFQPTLRAPLSKLPWLNVSTSLAFRTTWWSRSFDPDTTTVVDEPISRQYLEMQANLTGPIFGRIFDTPGAGFAQRWKHVVEPSVTFSRTTGVDKETVFDRIIPGYDAGDYVVGGATRITYALTNRLYTKRGEGVQARVRELAAFVLRQTYATDPLATLNDQNYFNSFTGEALSSKFSPIGASLRFAPTDANVTDVSAEYDTQFNAIRQVSARTALRMGTNLDLSAGWSQTRFILGLPGFDNPDRTSHFLNTSTTLRTTGNKYGSTVDLQYDLKRDLFLNQRITAYYNAQCCGVGVEYQVAQIPAFGSGQNFKDRRFNLSFTLAGIGSFSDFFGAFGADPYRR